MCNGQIRIGEIYMMEFTGTGCEQTGWRPGVVFKNNIGNTFSPNIIALPLTTAIKKCSQPTHVLISSKDSGIRKDSIVLCENPQRMSKSRIGNYITTLSDKYMSMIAKASLIATSAIAFVDPDDLLSIWQKTLSLNKQ